MPLVSIHGRALQFDPTAGLLYVNGQPFGPNRFPVRGRRIYVDSNNGADDVAGESPRNPTKFLQDAITRADGYAAEDNVGTEIIVMPNHAETITGVGGLTIAGPPGLTITGLGSYNQRPRFLMDGGTTVDFAISAADVTLRNLVFASGHADVVRCFNITAKGCWLDQIEFADNVADENWLTPIKGTSTSDNNADGLKVTWCRWLSSDAAPLEFIELNADVNDAMFHRNFIVHEGVASPLVLCATGKDLRYVEITWNFLSHKGAEGSNLLITNDTASPNNSGIVAHNRFGHADATGTHVIGALGGARFFDNLSTSVDNLSGFVLPAIDVNL